MEYEHVRARYMSPNAAAKRKKVSRQEARLAAEKLATGGLSHHDQRALRTITRSRELETSRRRQELAHLAIALVIGLAAMAVTGAALGLGPAIRAARGSGTVGTFVVSGQNCARRSGCVWVGTFEVHADVRPNVAYEGVLSADTQPGTRIAARYTGYQQVYAARGSHTWIVDVILMVLIGGVVGFFVYLAPVGLRQRRNAPNADAGMHGVEL
jgi:multisubunit Na+/H+ antiporter MnhB subunit